MAVTSPATRETHPAAPNANSANTPASTNVRASRTTSTGRPIPARPSRNATDDEILGIEVSSVGARSADIDGEPGADSWRDDAHGPSAPAEPEARQPDADATQSAEPEALRAALDANPDLRRAWDDAQAYRESFASPDDARTATALLADLDRMDALFFSGRPEDHAELARAVAGLDPAAFASLAQAMQGIAGSSVGARSADIDGGPGADAWQRAAHPSPPLNHAHEIPSESTTGADGHDPAKDDRRARHAVPLQTQQPAQPTPAQTEFFQATNAAAVEGVLEAIESQVERLLPEGISKSARNRVVGEIYRELDTTLQSNRQLAQQMRDAFRLALSEANVSGAPNPDHQRALVSLVTGRAKQALPGVAKRVLGEWTSTIIAANQDRRSRQHAAERRVDIAGSGGASSDGQRSTSPRDIDYRRMSDADILNL